MPKPTLLPCPWRSCYGKIIDQLAAIVKLHQPAQLRVRWPQELIEREQVMEAVTRIREALDVASAAFREIDAAAPDFSTLGDLCSLPGIVAQMRNFADVADHYTITEVVNTIPSIRTWADMIEQRIAAAPAGAQEAAAYRLTMRSGVSDRNDNVIGDFNDRITATVVGALLKDADCLNAPEYSRFDIDPVTNPPVGSEDSAYERGYREGYERRHAEVLAALA